MLNRLADGLVAQVENAQATVREAFFERVIRLGVTGPSQAGKTVFITSLVTNLLNRARMQGLRAEAEGRIQGAFLQPQPDDLVPRFDYEAHLARLTGPEPGWSNGTDRISELRISLRVAPGGLLGAVRDARRVHIDIVDYPGEWLLDLGLLEQSYGEWSDIQIARMTAREDGRAAAQMIADTLAGDAHNEDVAQRLAEAYCGYLHAARQAGFYDTTPGRFLMPGDLAGSPVLTFAPLAGAQGARRGSLGAEMARRFEAYKSGVVRPFFRDHFARLDRQVVLVDPLTALARGPQALGDLEGAMTTTLKAFRPGRNSFLSTLFRGRRIEKILFAATKADTLHHSQHGALTGLAQALLQGAAERAEFEGAETKAMALAALRTTSEEERDGLGMVVGRLPGRERPIASYPGALPAAPGDLLAIARGGAGTWPEAGFAAPDFLPRPVTLEPGKGLPHLRMDHAAEFLFGDLL